MYSCISKKINWKSWFFISIILLFSIIEQTIEPICKKATFLTSLYGVLHIIFSTYLAIGSLLFGMYKLHLTILILVLIGWLMFKGRCIAQIKYNKMCGIDEKSPFIDMQNVIFNKILGISGTIYKWPLILIIIGYDIYHIIN
tara:strand:+ start:284 stop:709 length:426 start_codon:yes stop_codon:yes gene_type:complete